MKIDDAQLSAFLDQELPESDMQALRLALRASPEMAQRLADLAGADAMTRLHGKAIDALPMPEAVTRLLNEGVAGAGLAGSAAANTGSRDSKVVSLSLWRQGRQFLAQHAARHTALAASVLLLLGFFAGWLPSALGPASGPAIPGSSSAAVLAALDSAPSGTGITVSGSELLPRFSFTDPQGRYCRQFRLQEGSLISENLACREADGWQLLASIQMSGVFPADEYQPASGMRLLDSILDEMMPGAALDLETEAALINSGW